MVTIEARPAQIVLDPARTAVIVVDVQNDFGSEGGMFVRAGIDVSAIRAVIGPFGRVLTAARSCGIRVMFLKMGFLDDLSDAGLPDAPNWLKHQPLKAGEHTTAADGSASRFLVRHTSNTEIVDELAAEPDDSVLYKHRYSGFYGTDLDAILRRRGIASLIFTGVHHERLCRVDLARRDVPRLQLPLARGLRSRADRTRPCPNQP